MFGEIMFGEIKKMSMNVKRLHLVATVNTHRLVFGIWTNARVYILSYLILSYLLAPLSERCSGGEVVQ